MSEQASRFTCAVCEDSESFCRRSGRECPSESLQAERWFAWSRSRDGALTEFMRRVRLLKELGVSDDEAPEQAARIGGPILPGESLQETCMSFGVIPTDPEVIRKVLGKDVAEVE